MRKFLLPLSFIITVISLGSSIYLATLTDPTDIQTGLSTTSNAIAIAGTTAIFGLLDDDDQDDSRIG